MSSFLVLIVLCSCFLIGVNLQGFGSGNNGNLRICVVEGRGTYKRASKHCPILEEENSGIECVIGTDRLDCLRRISKGTVDFGAFSPEDLIAAQWANVDVLVTNEIRLKNQPFAQNLVALVNRRILPIHEGKTLASTVLKNRTLCAPITDNDGIRSLNDVLGRYIESQVAERSCDPNLSLAENRIKSTFQFFGQACMAGPWVQDPRRDAELRPQKAKVLSLFHAFTGCDTVSSFNNKGKKSAFEVWNAFPTATEAFLAAYEGRILDAMTIIEKFVVILYDRSSSLTFVYECQKHLFTKKDRQLENIPSTKAALHQHFLRAVFQAVHVWGQLSPTQNLPSPTDWGWTKVGDSRQPPWTYLPIAADACVEMIRCRCKKKCASRCRLLQMFAAATKEQKYPSLCAACASHTCSLHDMYWGPAGSLNCMADFTGDVTWVDLDDIHVYFKKLRDATWNQFAYLCRDGSWQPIANNTSPCVWLQKPWNVVVAKRKAATAVTKVTSRLTADFVTVDGHWTAALAALLESHQELPAPLQPPKPPMDYLATALGFREAYSRHECDPPRHIILCTTSLLENNKCEWLSEAGAVYGVEPPLQCFRRNSTAECMLAIGRGECDVTVASSDWLVPALRDHSIVPILHEATPIIEKTSTVVAFTRRDSHLTKMADLRGKRAAFPRFDGVAFHSILRYLASKEKSSVKTIVDEYFSAICAPGIEKYNVTEIERDAYTRSCYKDGDRALEGEEQALRAVVEEKADVAFVSLKTYNMYKANIIEDQWARKQVELTKICPEESKKYCFISWANIGHVFASKNLTGMRHQEIVNVFTKFDKLFGRMHSQSTMFSIYGMFNHILDVVFHNNTKNLLTDEMYEKEPYLKFPLSFEKSLDLKDELSISDLTRSYAVKITGSLFLVPLLSLLMPAFSNLN